MAHQDLPASAPSSPRIKKADKRIMTVGCAPAMIGGMMAFAAPSAATVGFGLTLAIGLPILLHAVRLRRDNQRRWQVARGQAQAGEWVVKTVEMENGDHEYQLLTQAERDNERWGDDLERWQTAQTAQADEQDELDEDDMRA